jgi:hypothetical protein
MVGAARVVAALAIAWPLASRAAPASPALRIGVTPSTLRLAEGSRATLRVPCAREPPVLGASIGRIDAMQEVASGVYEAEYVPPDTLDPQVAFVTARCSEAFGWAPVVLAGMRMVTVAARYGTPVSVSVDDDQFGPVPADATGRAVVRVVVPPGVRYATYRSQRISLDVPAQPLVHVVLDRPALDASSGGVVAVRALSVDERGAPYARAPITLAASDGTLSKPVEIEPGFVQASWRLEPRKVVREATVTARLAGRPAAVAAAVLERLAGPPRRIAMEVSREAMVAGDGDELAVTALVTDEGGNPTDAPAALVASPGTVLGWDRVGTGRWAGRVQVPRSRSGRSELELEVVTAGALKAERAVALLPGAARQVRVDARDELFADGRTREIRVTVLDAHDNRVDVAAPPSVSAERGAVGSPARYGPGTYRLKYRAPLGGRDFTEEIHVSVGSLERAAPLRVRALGGGVVLSPKAGYTIGQGGLSSLAGGGEVGLWLPSFHGLGLLLEARAFAFERTDSVKNLQVRSEATFVALEASLAWRRPGWGGMAWLGAGGGAVSSSASVSAAGQPEVSEQAWAPAAHASVGWGRPLGPGIPFGEVKLGWRGDPGRGPLQGSLRSVTFAVGYRFDVL